MAEERKSASRDDPFRLSKTDTNIDVELRGPVNLLPPRAYSIFCFIAVIVIVGTLIFLTKGSYSPSVSLSGSVIERSSNAVIFEATIPAATLSRIRVNPSLRAILYYTDSGPLPDRKDYAFMKLGEIAPNKHGCAGHSDCYHLSLYPFTQVRSASNAEAIKPELTRASVAITLPRVRVYRLLPWRD